MYTLKEIKNKKIQNDFISKKFSWFYSFLQSYEWGEFHKKNGKKVFCFGIYQNKSPQNLIWILQIIEVKAKRGSYYLIPHGPLICENYFSVLHEILPKLKAIAKKNKICFIRINPNILNTKTNQNSYKKLWFKNAPMHEHAEDTHILNLEKPEEELFANIKKKDRYYINRAIKEWVTIRKDNKKDHREILKSMHKNHAKKVWYHQFSDTFIDSLYDVFDDKITTLSTQYNWVIESILMTIQIWDACVYYIAASDIKNPKFSPNYLCQWEAIKQAKKNGAKTYNFWWVSPDDNPKHPIAWVTQFKRKFWWYDYSLLHAQDLIISPKYYLNWCIETCRRLKRGYYYKKPQ